MRELLSLALENWRRRRDERRDPRLLLGDEIEGWIRARWVPPRGVKR